MTQLRTLVLGADFQPVRIYPDLKCIAAEDAFHKYFKGVCDVVHFYDVPVLSNHKQAVHPKLGPMFWPSVIAYRRSYQSKRPMRLTPFNLAIRDGHECAYCGAPVTESNVTKDHVMPKSKGGEDSWENVVACCDDCNRKKGNALPQGRWAPLKRAYEPTFYDLLKIRKKQPLVVDHESWIPFLPKWETEIIVRPPKNGFVQPSNDGELEEVL